MLNGPTAACSGVDIAPDGRVFVVGSVGGGPGQVFAWNGSAWEIWDVTATSSTIEVGSVDATIPSRYDIWIGTSTDTYAMAGTATVTTGTAVQYPVFKVSRSGASSATLYSLRNETTGKALMFNYGLLDGETLTVDMGPGQRSITSSFWGPRPDAILANSDFGSFALQPGSNQITCFVSTAAATVTAWLEWRDAYRGLD
jgi:phage-related protein